jgi:RecA-family ATPase
LVFDGPAKDGRRARITWADEIRIRPVIWAWSDDGAGRLPAGSLSVAAGREGTGKSSFGIWLTAQITRGTLPGSLHGTPRRVLYAAVEDSWEHTLAPRLKAAGADLRMVGRFDVVADDDEQVMMCLPSDNRLLEAAIAEHHVAAVVLDPLMSLLSGQIDSHRTHDVRKALDPLARMADRTGCLMLGIAHFNKGSGTDPSSLITGSGAFKDVPRSVFGFVRDSDSDDGTRVMTQTKNNLGRDELPSLKYVIETAYIDTPEGVAEVGRLVWQGESDRTATDILRDAGTPPEDRDERSDAASWLRDYLLDHGAEAR